MITSDHLDRVEVSSPCSEDWSDMPGDERVRQCRRCQLAVYNLSAMTRTDALELLNAHTGHRVCVKFYRRADGTLITSDCPRGRATAMSRFAARLVLWLALFGLLALSFLPSNRTRIGKLQERLSRVHSMETFLDLFRERPPFLGSLF